MNRSEAENIAKKYILLQNKNDDLSIDIPVYKGCKKIYTTFLSIWHKNNLYFDIRKYVKPSKYRRLVVSRILDKISESKMFWCVLYKSNIAQKYIKYEDLFNGGNGTFLICKATQKKIETQGLILDKKGRFDEKHLAVLDKDYELYLTGELEEVKYMHLWEQGIPPRE